MSSRLAVLGGPGQWLSQKLRCKKRANLSDVAFMPVENRRKWLPIPPEVLAAAAVSELAIGREGRECRTAGFATNVNLMVGLATLSADGFARRKETR
jgi:hypothetical protein